MEKFIDIFTTLNYTELIPDENKLEILLQSDKITFKKSVTHTYYEDFLDFLEYKLIDNIDYYVIDDFRVYKGKQIVKSGKTVVSNKEAILDFVKQNYYKDDKLIEDDVNPIKIISKLSPQFVISIGNDCENGLRLFKDKKE